ncbi:hypothetical protein S245_071050, partial [Arachis hypogaea]
CEDYAICFLLSTRMASHNYMASAKSVSLYCISSGVSQSAIAALFCKINFGQKQFSTCCFGLTQPCFIDKFRRMTWSVRSSLNDSNFSLSTSNETQKLLHKGLRCYLALKGEHYHLLSTHSGSNYTTTSSANTIIVQESSSVSFFRPQ